MKKSVLIISYVPPYNRQGYDLAKLLRDGGYNVRLFQRDGISDKSEAIVGIKVLPAHGPFRKIYSLRNFLAFLVKSITAPKQVVVCVGRSMLLLGALYCVIFRSRLIWYSLEYEGLGRLGRYIYRHFVSGYIDVEENRREKIFERYGEKESIICYNMPMLQKQAIKGGKLRAYLSKEYGFGEDEKLVIYAGSKQKYACLDNIFEAGKSLRGKARMILMTFGLPQGMGDNQCIVVPPIKGSEFYEWLSDADCALLPYEDDTDFNVINCSPQKVFDCFAVGVPVVASNRPLIRKVYEACPEGCIFCDFKNVQEIVNKIEIALTCKAESKEQMKRLHATRYNYNTLYDHVASLIEGV